MVTKISEESQGWNAHRERERVLCLRVGTTPMARGTYERDADERPESSSRCANPHTPSFLYANEHVILSWPSTVLFGVRAREDRQAT